MSLRLYVAGHAPNSEQARVNLAVLLDTSLTAMKVEIVDVLDHPDRAIRDGIIVTPTLLRQGSTPVRVVGSLANLEQVRTALGLVRA